MTSLFILNEVSPGLTDCFQALENKDIIQSVSGTTCKREETFARGGSEGQ